jgi:hypothetical protein
MNQGDVFHRLTVLQLIPDGKNPKAKCLCTCGSVVTPQCGSLKNGRAKSCGCLRKEQNSTSNLTHGKSKTSEYKAFQAMKVRCTDPRNRHFANYGGRGIRVEYADFQDFISDVGPKPSGAWIDRKDNEGNYARGNCRWVTPRKNQMNKRDSRIWTVNGIEYESSVIAAAVLGVASSVVIRGCNGYTRNGKTYFPRDGWSSRLKYPLDQLNATTGEAP